MISLDWDDVDLDRAKARCLDILKWSFVDHIDLFISPTKTGFHVYVYLSEEFEPSPCALTNLRKEWHDDPQRIKNDQILREGNQSVLFHYKMIDGMVHHQRFVTRFSK